MYHKGALDSEGGYLNGLIDVNQIAEESSIESVDRLVILLLEFQTMYVAMRFGGCPCLDADARE